MNLQQSEPEINKLFRFVVKLRGSALFLSPDEVAGIRLDECIHPMEMQSLSQKNILDLLRQVMTAQQQLVLDSAGSVEFVHLLVNPERRVCVHVANKNGRIRVAAYPLPF